MEATMNGVANASRALTLIECLKRLQTADTKAEQRVNAAADASPCKTHNPIKATHSPTGTLTIHLVGADYREGNSAQETTDIFKTLFQYLAIEDKRYDRLELVLVGPNVAQRLHFESHESTHLATRAADSTSSMLLPAPEIHVKLSYYVGSFDDFYCEKDHYSRPDLAVCFNAGLWGYDEWVPTLKLLVHTIRTPLLVTSYNENEGIDDEDVLEDDALVTRWFWRSEKNPSGSSELRSTQNEDGYILKENDYWMCARPNEVVA